MKIVEREIKGRKGCDKRHDVSCRMPHRASGLTSRAPWPKVKLGEIGRVAMCKRVLNRETADTGEIPFFKIGTFGKKANAFITRDKFEYYRTHYSYPKKGNVLISAAGTIGRLVVFNGESAYFQDSNIVWLEHDGQRLCDKYLYYFLLGHEWQFTQGATIQRLYNDDVRNTEIPLPPLPVQRRIADILSAYDDLIENNRRRIAILEETARLTYRKWFGGAEQSWVAKLGKVSDFFDVSIGRTPPRKNEECFSTESTDLKWLSIKDMRASRVFVLDTTEKLTKAGIEKTHIHVSPPGTIFLSFKLTVGEVVIAGDSMATNEAIAHFETNDRALRDYTYFYLSSFQYDKLGSTSAIARAINSDIVRKMDFVFPARNVLERFGKDVAPMFDQIENLTRQNVALAAARDMLLPRLMTNKLRKEA